MAQLVKNPPAVQETTPAVPELDSWIGKTPWRRGRLRTPVSFGFPAGLVCKESTHSVGDPGSVPGLGRSSGRGHGRPLQYSYLGNPTDRGA